MSDRVLVTGATGFVGSHLVEALLQKGDQVACLVRPTSDTSNLPGDKLEFRQGDVTNPSTLPDAVEGMDVVYHVAGALEARSLAQLNTVNEAGTQNLARACAELQSPPVLLLVSSIEAAGPDPEGHVRTERDSSAPVSNYGRSKLASERILIEFADSLPITVVRASAVFGERDRETYQVVKALQMPGLDLYAIPRAHTTRLSLIHARDLAEMLLLAVDRGERMRPDYDRDGIGMYYGADSEVLSLADLFGQVAQVISGDSATIVDMPVGFAWITAGFLEWIARIRGKSPGVISLDKVRSFSAGSFTCSPAKASEQLGFAPTYSLSERLSQTIGWYQAEGWL